VPEKTELASYLCVRPAFRFWILISAVSSAAFLRNNRDVRRSVELHSGCEIGSLPGLNQPIEPATPDDRFHRIARFGLWALRGFGTSLTLRKLESAEIAIGPQIASEIRTPCYSAPTRVAVTGSTHEGCVCTIRNHAGVQSLTAARLSPDLCSPCSTFVFIRLEVHA
jgi:hypothetical protein